MRIILGSTSRPRAKVMSTIVPAFDVMDAGIDEKAIRASSPQGLTSKLAIAKSHALRSRIGAPAILITADTVVLCGDEVREKPTDAVQARRFLESYRTERACVVTTVLGWNSESGEEDLVVDESRVRFRDLTDEAIDVLVEDGVVFDGAGGFVIGHELFGPHIDGINGSETSAMGLPRRLTETMLRSLGGL